MNLPRVPLQEMELIQYQRCPELLQRETFASFVFQRLLLQIKKDFFTWCMLMRVLKRWLLLASICLTFFAHQSGFLTKM